jgi:hypothetical protein
MDIYSSRYRNSILFVNNILDNKFEKKFEFITYEFNIFEISKAIKDEINNKP